VRRTDLTELVHDITTTEAEAAAQTAATGQRGREAEEFLQKVREARQEEKEMASRGATAKGPVETVHRTTETLTAEELNEQLNLMENNIQKQIKKDIDTQVVTENHVTHQTEVRTSDTNVKHLTARDVEQLVENGVKSQMNTISNQVLTKLERQMRNEKMRRGY
jgi:hypothetical protein